jgi:hypothetical protein
MRLLVLWHFGTKGYVHVYFSFLAVQAVNEQPAADAALALIQHDKEVLHVLHTGRSAGSSGTSSSSSGASSSSQGGGDSSQQGSNGVPGCMVKWCNVSSKAARNKETSQQQQQLTQQEAVGLVQEVLTVCVTYDMAELCQAVAALPAAKQIGEGPCKRHHITAAVWLAA